MEKIVFISWCILFMLPGIQAYGQKSDEVYMVVEEEPVYPGGEEAFMKDMFDLIKYPEDAKKNKITGKVYISFVVNKKGEIEEAKVLRGVYPSLDKEVLIALYKIDKVWKPGRQSGKAVKTQLTIPVNFSLDVAKEQKSGLKTGDREDIFEVTEIMP